MPNSEPIENQQPWELIEEARALKKELNDRIKDLRTIEDLNHKLVMAKEAMEFYRDLDEDASLAGNLMVSKSLGAKARRWLATYGL